MPNWVFNSLTIQDHNPETIHLIKNQLNRPYERTYNQYWDRETQAYTTKTIKYSNPVFAFWNIKAPTDLEAYEKNYDFGGQKPYEGSDWYAFNNREWGTKWDVGVPDGETYSDTCLLEHKSEGEDHWLVYKFDTAWSPPVEALIKLSNQYPTAVITLEWQEEQGFGGEIEFVNGKITAESDYDTICYDCDEKDTKEYCDVCQIDVCSSCKDFGEADPEDVKQCETHREEAMA